MTIDQVTTSPLERADIDIEGDEEVELQRWFHERDLTDGLPIIVPTIERVEAFLAVAGFDRDEVIGAVDPARGIATVGGIAVNALMAGCLPEHLPVVVAAVDAMLQPAFRLHGVQATTNPVAPLAIVNGPIRHRLGIDSGRNALSPGQHANGPIGRAIRFVLRNIGGAVGDVDRSTLGSAEKYTFCLAEAEESSPWEPLSVSLGHRPGQDAVSVIGVESRVNAIPVFHHAEPIIEQLARAFRGLGTGMYWSRGTALFVINPGHAAILSGDGYTRERLQEVLFEKGSPTLEELPEGNIAQGEWHVENGRVRITESPSDIWIMVAGGPEPLHSVYMTGFGVANGVTAAIRAGLMPTLVTQAPLEDEVNAFFAHDPRLMNDPWPLYERLRTEAPVFRHADKLLVSRWSDARAVLVAPATLQGLAAKGTRFRNATARLDEEHQVELAEMFGFLEKRLGGANGDRHTRLRALAQKAFTPRMIATMEQRITEVAENLLEPLLGRDRIEVIEEFAYHLPLIVISEMLDIPSRDRENLRVWANDLGQFVGANWHAPAEVERGHAAVFNLRSYLSAVFESRRGGPTTDLLGGLLAAEGDGGDRFTEDELVAMITQFVFAGHETTTNTIGNGLVTLLRDYRDQWGLLCEDPSLIPGAVEEILRFSPPTHNVEKLVGVDGELGGVPVRQYDSLSVMLAAANRDPEVFDEPDRFDVRRAPNPHLTFGFGAHHCIGSALARMEAQVAFRLLARRVPDMRLESETVEWRPNHMLRGPQRLPIVLGRAHRSLHPG